jgi:Family of unknown function (DUF6011)
MFDTSNIGWTRVKRGANPGVSPTPEELRAAAERFGVRNDQFAAGKSDICLDLAAKVERYGSFVSEKQQQFALKLIEWAKPRANAPAGTRLPKLFAVMQKHATLHVDPLKLSRRNQDSLVWVMYNDLCVGKIESETLSLFKARLGLAEPKVRSMLAEFEADPLEAAKRYGKLSGRCCSCGRDLTDPASIEMGIGPICAQRFGGF